MNRFQIFRPVAVMSAVFALAACGGSGDTDNDVVPPQPVVTLGNTLAVTASGRVISFDRTTPGALSSSVALSGLAAGESLVGFDVRPADGLVYAVSSTSRIYTLDAKTGVLTFKSALSTPLAGSQFGVDFNPVADRLRLVSNTGQNLRVDVNTGAATVDGAINGVPGAAITASAYTNSFAGATSTQLFNLDAAGTVYLQDPPNNGTLASPVQQKVAFTASNGFDIDARNNQAYAALSVNGTAQLYTVALSGTDGAKLIGTIGTGEALVGLTLTQPAAALVYVLDDAAQLRSFSPSTPATLSAPVRISGLNAGESVLGIDFRPSNARLYALTSTGRLLTVDPTTGAATAGATLSADATDMTARYAGLNGTSFVVDFNPAADRLRVISNLGQSLRINVDTGATTTDGDINRATPAVVVAGAYTNSFAGTTATDLFDIDGNERVLAKQTPPNNGTLVNVGPLNLAVTGAGSMDIAGGANGLVLAALRTAASGPFSLYTVSLTTGVATLYGNTSGDAARSNIGGTAGPVVRDIAIRY